MKNLVVLFALVLLSVCAFGQGNLQFNQVVKVQWSETSPAVMGYHSLGPQVVTVPVGKVLKIESCSVSASRLPLVASYADAVGTFGSYDPPSLFLEETMIFSSGGASSTSGYIPIESKILWLPAGSHNFYIGGYSSGPASSFTATVTAIEFNVVP